MLTESCYHDYSFILYILNHHTQFVSGLTQNFITWNKELIKAVSGLVNSSYFQ